MAMAQPSLLKVLFLIFFFFFGFFLFVEKKVVTTHSEKKSGRKDCVERKGAFTRNNQISRAHA